MDGVSQLALRSKGSWGYSPDFLDSCRAELTYTADDLHSEDKHFAVAETQHSVVGFYGLHALADREFELEALFVDPAFMGLGIGAALLSDARATVVRFGGVSLIVQADPNAKAFYVHAGGTRIGESESGSIPGRYLPLFAFASDANSRRR